jgi:phospholipid/cholesterol/gamma-HCH transport system substrate-binding protein
MSSLLGSTHVELDPVPGTAPAGRLAPGTTIPLNQSSTYPSTERTLAALATVVDGGGVGQIGGIIHSFNNAFDGRQESIRDLIGRLDRFVGTIDDQRDDIVTTIRALNGLAGTFAGQRDAITEALRVMPQALEVMVAQRPNITAALTKLRTFSDTATALINDTQADLVENLRHMEPITRSLADVGIVIDKSLAMATTFPYGQTAIDRDIKGDYLNLSATVDLTLPRIRRELWMGTRFGDPTQGIQAAIGDPGYAEQTKDPLGIGVAPPPAVIAPRPPEVAPPPLPGPAPAPGPDQGGH